MTLLAQVGPAPTGPMDMILGGTPSTMIILGVLAVFSLASWSIMAWKLAQFRKLGKQGVRFLQSIEKTPKLRDAYRTLARLPDSPYTRVFRQGLTFFNELRPGSLTDDPAVATREGLSEAQLQALRLVLEKGQAEERDDIAAGLIWLAVIGTVSPLLGRRPVQAGTGTPGGTPVSTTATAYWAQFEAAFVSRSAVCPHSGHR